MAGVRGFGVVSSALGLPMIQWSVEGQRHELERSVDELVVWNLRKARPGAIVLMHANAVRRLGYGFVTVGGLLRMGPAATVDDGCFDTPGDNRCEDELFGGKGTLGRLK